ncbi:hypothetical protein A0256_02930 [Mucilaginibacter sp. PAMC 26640]|nr:hypothetical protein A0256_02930 [Mucilaginibacter sp. PAMC 26640]
MAFFAQGCKLDPPLYGPPPKEDWSLSYQPVSNGSYWKYTIDQAGVAQDSSVLTVTGDKPVFNGKEYHTIYADTKHRKGNGYCYSDKNIITTRQANVSYNGQVTEIKYYDDTIPVGGSWEENITDDGTLNGVPARMIGTLVAKDLTRTVHGINFPRVAHTRLLLQQDWGEGWETFATYDYYMNMGIGVIENVGVQADGTDLGKIRIYDYSIK